MNKNLNKLVKNLTLKESDYYLISTFDEYLYEYVPEYNMRLKFLTNFSGTNGIALISKKKKYFLTDGRYLLQAKKEISKQFELIDLTKTNFFTFFKQKIKKSRILADFKLFRIDFIKKLKQISQSNNNTIIDDLKNTVDEIWVNKPVRKKKKIFLIKRNISGENTENKKKKIFAKSKYDLFIITSSDSICWLLNIRGYDLPNTPIVFSKIIMSVSEIKLFIDLENLSKEKIAIDGVKIFKESDFENEISKISRKSNIFVDNSISYFYYNLMNSKNLKLDFGTDPCQYLKCQKNKVEIMHAKKSHILDGISLVKFFYWLDKQNISKDLCEMKLSKKLEDFRKLHKSFFFPSFPTISAIGANGSIIHYNPRNNPKKLLPNQLYLCDSGGQYLGATTDVTRTIHIGKKKPIGEFKSNYTSVLKGHIDLSTIRFPVGTRGSQIDAIARYYLWKKGLDYNHGTGHGVGSFLGVHEGPQSISKRIDKDELKEGMILSNEPGFYRNNKYGIRIENLILVIKSKFKGFLEFETLTLFPYERDLIDINELTVAQIKWVNNYHSKVYKSLKKGLEVDERKWLKKNTQEFKIKVK